MTKLLITKTSIFLILKKRKSALEASVGRVRF